MRVIEIWARCKSCGAMTAFTNYLDMPAYGGTETKTVEVRHDCNQANDEGARYGASPIRIVGK